VEALLSGRDPAALDGSGGAYSRPSLVEAASRRLPQGFGGGGGSSGSGSCSHGSSSTAAGGGGKNPYLQGLDPLQLAADAQQLLPPVHRRHQGGG